MLSFSWTSLCLWEVTEIGEEKRGEKVPWSGYNMPPSIYLLSLIRSLSRSIAALKAQGRKVATLQPVQFLPLFVPRQSHRVVEYTWSVLNGKSSAVFSQCRFWINQNSGLTVHMPLKFREQQEHRLSSHSNISVRKLLWSFGCAIYSIDTSKGKKLTLLYAIKNTEWHWSVPKLQDLALQRPTPKSSTPFYQYII